MQYIDNDMDELFNKAGRDYPLKTDNGNWDAVAGKLQQPDASAAPLNPTTNRKYYWWLLLLLLPLSYLVYDNSNSTKPANADAEKKTNTSANDNSVTKANNHNGTVNSENNKLPIDAHNNDGTVNNTTANAKTSNRINNKIAAGPNLGAGDKVKANNKITTNDIQNSELSLSSLEKRSVRELHGISANQRNYTLPHIPVSYNLSPYSIVPPPVKTMQSPETKKPKHLKTSGFYAGLLVGPDLSTVKYQKIKNVGYNIGILAGYRFSNRWSVEAGVLYNKKEYYTDGKYFDKTRTNIPASVRIAHLDGICEMFEVPIAVRYNFSRKESTLFATAGITSYFMNEEKYEYGAWSGSTWYEGYRSYDNSGNNFFSNMQLSIGYNYKLSKKLNVRIEPYIKIPVSDIGIGNLPITSTGVYFGIMRNIR